MSGSGVRPPVATTTSDIFTVTSAKKFQGMLGAPLSTSPPLDLMIASTRRLTRNTHDADPTPLSQTLAAQGVRIPTRKVARAAGVGKVKKEAVGETLVREGKEGARGGAGTRIKMEVC